MNALDQRAKSIEAWAESHFIDSNGIVYSQIDKASGRPLTDAFFDPESERHLKDVPLADFWKYENCGMTTGAYLQALICRYEVEHDPAALQRARRCFSALRHVYDLGKQLEEGFFPKIYGARFSIQTSTDQVLYAALAMDRYAPHADEKERSEIARMITHMVRFWVKRSYHYLYFKTPDMLWPLNRFPSLLLLAFNHSGDPQFKAEYDRLLAEGWNQFPGNEQLRRKQNGEAPPSDYEKQHHAWLIGHMADSLTMDMMEFDYLLRHDPANRWAVNWRQSARQMWGEARLTLAPNGKVYIHMLVDMDTGIPRPIALSDCSEFPGAQSGWSTMIARAGVQATAHLPEQQDIPGTALHILQSLDIQDLTYFDEPERFSPRFRFKTRFLSGDAITNWLWAYWQGRLARLW